MLGIALGVAALIVVLSVMNGFQKEVRDRMLGVLSHIEVSAVDGQTLQRLPELIERLRAHPQVLGAAPFVGAQALVARGSDMKGALVRGIDPAQEPEVTEIAAQLSQTVLPRLVAGEFGVILGGELARNLQVGVGDSVTVIAPSGQVTPAGVVPRVRRMTVVGSFDSGHPEFDAGLALLHVQDAARLFRVEGPTGVRVKIRDLHAAREVAAQLDRELKAAFGTDGGSGWVVSDWTSQNRTWFAAVQLEKRMMFIILTLIVAVAAFNLVATLVMTVTDKRADIAILRTLGASPKSIMGVFMVQGALVGLIGTGLGLLLGVGLAFHIDTLVPALERALGSSLLPQDIYLISRMPSDPQRGDILPVGVIALVLALLATIYPSWRASRVNPAEALRYE
jgi:lipoprotein-releasing system permease protein